MHACNTNIFWYIGHPVNHHDTTHRCRANYQRQLFAPRNVFLHASVVYKII